MLLLGHKGYYSLSCQIVSTVHVLRRKERIYFSIYCTGTDDLNSRAGNQILISAFSATPLLAYFPAPLKCIPYLKMEAEPTSKMLHFIKNLRMNKVPKNKIMSAVHYAASHTFSVSWYLAVVVFCCMFNYHYFNIIIVTTMHCFRHFRRCCAFPFNKTTHDIYTTPLTSAASHYVNLTLNELSAYR
jgi:hypothetical protein